MSAAPSAACETLFLKTKLCRFNATGTCKRGAACKFAHSKRELQPLPNFSCTKLCPDLRELGSCSRGASCNFAHSVDDLRARTRGHAQLIDDFRALLRSQGMEAEAAMPPTLEAVQPPPPPPAPPAMMLTTPAQVPQVPLQPQQCAANQAQWYPQWCPTGAGVADYHTAVCIVVPCGSTMVASPPTVEQTTVAASELESLSVDLFPTCGKAMDEDDEDLDLAGGSWSRQSTTETAGLPLQEFSGIEEESWTERSNRDELPSRGHDCELGSEFEEKGEESRVVDGANCALKPRWSELPNVAAACGLSYSVKNSFLAFEDDDDEPVCQLRRVRSTGALSQCIL